MRQDVCFTDAVVAIGSNIDKERNVPEALRLLRRHQMIDVRAVSPLYVTEPVGGPADAPEFFNAAVLVCTELTCDELRTVLREIEDELGRVRTADPDAPRTIDLDVIRFGEELVDPQGLSQPHVVIPLADVDPEWRHPESGLTPKELANDLDRNGVNPTMAIHLSTPYGTRGAEDFDDVSEVYSPRLESLVRQQLVEIGENPDREGLARTPLRVAKALDFLTSGYTTDLEEIVNNAIFDSEGADEMVLVKDIEFYSMCEHHMLPFFGTAAVAYIPDGKIIGLSKIARIVDLFSRRLQVQERLTNEVADALLEILEPHGAAVVMEGKHLCMMMRGVQKQDSSMITSAMRGTFREDPRTRNEFLDLART